MTMPEADVGDLAEQATALPSTNDAADGSTSEADPADVREQRAPVGEVATVPGESRARASVEADAGDLGESAREVDVDDDRDH